MVIPWSRVQLPMDVPAVRYEVKSSYRSPHLTRKKRPDFDVSAFCPRSLETCLLHIAPVNRGMSFFLETLCFIC